MFSLCNSSSAARASLPRTRARALPGQHPHAGELDRFGPERGELHRDRPCGAGHVRLPAPHLALCARRWSGSARLLWGAIVARAQSHSVQPWRLLDVATGGGDIPIQLWHKARRAGDRTNTPDIEHGESKHDHVQPVDLRADEADGMNEQ